MKIKEILTMTLQLEFGETWEALLLCLKQMKKGTQFITTSKKLPPDAFRVSKITHAQMSWGVVKVYIQQRV